MARYTQESVERARDAVDFADLVGSRTELRRSGVNQLQGLCPFHDERTPSFGIDPVKKVFHCFGCGEGGSEVDFVMKLDGLDFKSAIEYLADRYGVQLEVEDEDPAAAQRRMKRERMHELLDRTAGFYERVLWESKEAAHAREYLLGRGLSEEVLRTFRVGYAPSAWDTVLMASQRAGYSQQELFETGLAKRNQQGKLYDQFRGRITFPLCDTRGRVIGFGARQMGEDRGPKYLNTPENELFHKGRIVYGAHLARSAAAKAGSVIVAEGYTDVIALHQAGFAGAVCIMGTSMTEEQVRVLRRIAPVAHLALDADNAGQDAMLRAAEIAAREDLRLRVLGLRAGDDPADLIAREGPEAVEKLLEKAMPFARFRVLRILEKGDTSSSEGKQEILDEIHETFARLPEVAAGRIMRDELIQILSSRLDVHADVVARHLSGPPPRRPATQRSGNRPHRSASPPTNGSRGGADATPRRGDAGVGPGSPGPGGGDGSRVAAASRGGTFAGDRPAHLGTNHTRGGDRTTLAARDDFGDPGSERAPFEDFAVADSGYSGSARGDSGGFVPAGRRGSGSDLATILAREEEVERRFLAFCVALPEQGADALRRIDASEHFTAPVTRRAAEHLRTHLTDPTGGIPGEDEELRALMTELTVRASAEPASPATLDAQRLQLELRRLDRRLAAIRASGEGGAQDLAVRRQEVKNELDAAMVRAVDAL